MNEKDPLISEMERAKKRLMWRMVLREPKELIKREPLASAVFSLTFAAVFFIVGFLNLRDPNFLDDLAIICTIVAIAPVGFTYEWYERRRRKLEDRFIDFIRDLTDVTKAGMTLAEALSTVSKRDYGVLSREVRKMASEISWRIPFNDVLQRFSERVNSLLIRRTVSLIIQANISGGNFEDVITSAARDARETKLLDDERRREMLMYTLIVYISFFVFLFVIFVLAKMFLPELARTSLTETSIGGFSMGGVSPEEINRIFLHASVIQGFFSGLIAGKMGEGSILLGIKHSVVLIIAAYSLFTFFL